MEDKIKGDRSTKAGKAKFFSAARDLPLSLSQPPCCGVR